MKKHKMEIKTSADFKDDPEGAVDALDHSGFAIFMITDHWYDDERAVKEWRYAKDINKPMLYILEKGVELNKFLMDANVIAVIPITKRDVNEAGPYIQAVLAAYCKVNDIKL